MSGNKKDEDVEFEADFLDEWADPDSTNPQPNLKPPLPPDDKEEGECEDDDDDEMDQILSQIDEAALLQASVSPSLKRTSAESLDTSTSMGPPSTTHVPRKRPSLDHPVSPTTTSTSPSLSLSTDNTPSSREVFFSNWNTEELASFEEKMRKTVRRFPGPAGLLPKLTPEETRHLKDTDHPLSQVISKIIHTDLLRISRIRTANFKDSVPVDIISPQDREILQINKGPWKELTKQLSLDPTDPEGLLKLMNIRWVRRKASRHPVTTKIPFLAVVVQEDTEQLGNKRKLTERGKNPSLKLMDSTGTVVAAMDPAFVDAFGAELIPGTAIALKNAGFLRFKRQLILTITQKNVICMTAVKRAEVEPNESKLKFMAPKRKSTVVQTEPPPEIEETPRGIRVFKFSEFTPTQMREDYLKIHQTNLALLYQERENKNEEDGPQLFNPRECRPRPVTAPLLPQQDSANRNFVSSGGGQEKHISSAPSSVPVGNDSEDFSMFGDEEDEELMLEALNQVDFLMDNSEDNPVN